MLHEAFSFVDLLCCLLATINILFFETSSSISLISLHLQLGNLANLSITNHQSLYLSLMQKLSVAIITFNEEKNIQRCLQSIAPIADEIVVVDSLSTDATESICQNFNVRFIKQAFLGYIEQKNLALSYCTNAMVLCLDADEALSSELLQAIKNLKQQGFIADGYIMKRCTFFMGKWIKHGTWYPDKKLRLVNKEKAKWGGTNPHDELQLQTNNQQFLNADILHYSYNSLDEVITQNNKFTNIQAKAMYHQGKKSSWLKILVNPCVAFITGYIFKLGFLDGWRGYFIAKSVAYQTFCKYIKLKSLGNYIHKDTIA